MKTHHALKSVFVLAVVLLGCTRLASAQIVFDHRENVDLLNSDLVTLTGGSIPQSLSMSIDQASFWEGSGTSATITIDLGQIQNIKTFKMSNQFGLAIPNATIEVASSLAGPWSLPLTANITDPLTAQENVVLDNAVDTRYVRVIANSTTGGSGRWVLNDLRVYGDTGTLAAGNHQDLISSSGLTKLGTPDWVTVTPGTAASNASGGPFADDNPSNIYRKDFYGLTTGSTVLFNFDRTVNVGTFGFTQAGGFYDPSSTFEYELLGSSDGGLTYTIPLLDHTGVEPTVPTFIPLQQGYTGTAIEFKIVNSTVSNVGAFAGLRFGDFELLAPEPASSALFAIGSLMLLRRRRRFVAAATRVNHQ